jgi:hypothetical protein
VSSTKQQSALSYYTMISLAGLVTIALWQIPNGDTILWPFTLLATWVHEMGHGLMAAGLTEFIELEIYKDAGGVARTVSTQELSLSNALIAGAGLLGPAIAGSLFIIFGRKEKTARYLLGLLGTAMMLSLICISNRFGMIAVGLWSLTLLSASYFGSNKVCYFFVQFIGLQFCINNFKDFDYMFTDSFTKDGITVISDSGNIARNLSLPYWFWGILVATLSIVMLICSLSMANSKGRPQFGAK